MPKVKEKKCVNCKKPFTEKEAIEIDFECDSCGNVIVPREYIKIPSPR